MRTKPRPFFFGATLTLIGIGSSCQSAPKQTTPPRLETELRPQIYFEFQVEKPVTILPGSPRPEYPAALRAAAAGGEVLVQFVVRKNGQVDMGEFRVLKSTHPLLTEAVRNVLPLMHFSPAEVHGTSVDQLVQQVFMFAVPARSQATT